MCTCCSSGFALATGRYTRRNARPWLFMQFSGQRRRLYSGAHVSRTCLGALAPSAGAMMERLRQNAASLVHVVVPRTSHLALVWSPAGGLTLYSCVNPLWSGVRRLPTLCTVSFSRTPWCSCDKSHLCCSAATWACMRCLEGGGRKLSVWSGTQIGQVSSVRPAVVHSARRGRVCGRSMHTRTVPCVRLRQTCLGQHG